MPPRAEFDGGIGEGADELGRGRPGAGCPRPLAQLTLTLSGPPDLGTLAGARRPQLRLPREKLAALPAGLRREGAGAAPPAD